MTGSRPVMYYHRPWRIWVGMILDAEDNQVGDCLYFGNRELAKAWFKETQKSL